MNALLIMLLLASHCGTERWEIKTLADPEASSISTAISDSTIEALRKQLPPTETELKTIPDHRYQPVEGTRYRIHALFLGYKEESDSDLHLVLASPKNPKLTLVAEIPAGSCVPKALQSQEADLQAWVRKRFGRPPVPGRMLRFTQPRLVVVEGIGFFDFLHGQAGVAPNGIELHPVTRLVLDSTTLKVAKP